MNCSTTYCQCSDHTPDIVALPGAAFHRIEWFRDALINKEQSQQGGMAMAEWTQSVRAVSDIPVVAYSVLSVHIPRYIAYPASIKVSPFLLAQSVSYINRSPECYGQL
jgi:hypothetical protein